jgi:thymidylate synthase (FAD)
MQVKLLHNTPLWVASKAIRKCWASEDKSDNGGEKDKELIYRVGNKNKHASTLEHLNYTFDIDGVSRALLQEKARHRHASISVKSTRYTLKELKDKPNDGSFDYRSLVVLTTDTRVNTSILRGLSELQLRLREGISNDLVKYILPEAYKTSYVWTINARSLQNFLELRSSSAALWEIRLLAQAIYDAIPDDHKYLFKECMQQEV